MDSAKKAADEVQVTIADARKTIAAATELIRDAKSGSGLLATLLNNQAARERFAGADHQPARAWCSLLSRQCRKS